MFAKTITKSLIQQEREKVETLAKFRESVESILEKWDVQGAVFGMNGGIVEIMDGYLDVRGEYNDLHEALKEIRCSNDGVYIEGSNYCVGTVRPVLTECLCDTIIDIETLKRVTL